MPLPKSCVSACVCILYVYWIVRVCFAVNIQLLFFFGPEDRALSASAQTTTHGNSSSSTAWGGANSTGRNNWSRCWCCRNTRFRRRCRCDRVRIEGGRCGSWSRFNSLSVISVLWLSLFDFIAQVCQFFGTSVT